MKTSAWMSKSNIRFTCDDTGLVLSFLPQLLLRVGRARPCGLGCGKVKEEMIAVCPLDPPQLSTTADEESHRDPASSPAGGWHGGSRETLLPHPLPAHPFPSSPGKGGGSLPLRRGGSGRGGRAARKVPGRPAKPGHATTDFSSKGTLTFGAHRPSFKLKEARKARAHSCPLVVGGGREPRTSAGATLRPSGRAASGRPGRARGRHVARRSLSWARRALRVARLGQVGPLLKGALRPASHAARVTPVGPQPPGAEPRGSLCRGTPETPPR